MTIDDIRTVLKYVRIQGSGQYDYLELQVLLSRMSDPDQDQHPTLLSTLLVIAEILKKKEITPETLFQQEFNGKTQITFE